MSQGLEETKPNIANDGAGLTLEETHAALLGDDYVPPEVPETKDLTLQEAATELENAMPQEEAPTPAPVEETTTEEAPVIEQFTHPHKPHIWEASQQWERERAEALQKYKSVNWEALRQQDPALWTNARNEWIAYDQNLKQRGEQIQKAWAEANSEEQEHKVQQLKKRMQWEHSRLSPEIKESIKTGELRAYLKDKGFADEDLDSVTDHRVVKVAYDAMRQSRAQEDSRKVTQIPLKRKDGTRNDVENEIAREIQRMNVPADSMEAAAVRMVKLGLVK